MPTLLRLEGFQFFFYSNEHEPEHVHVLRAEEFAKINLRDLEVVVNFMKPKTLKRALEITRENQEEFLEAWDEFFNQR